MLNICFKNTFNHETKLNSIDKINVNKIYTKYTKKSHKHLILESENGITISHLKNKGISEKNIYVVNGCKKTCEIISNFIPETNISWNISTNYLETTSNKFGSIWIDACCTKEGHSSYKPLNDLKHILQKKIIINGGIVGFTFSKREHKKHWKNRSINKHKLSLKEIKKSHKYKLFKNIKSRKESRWNHSIIDFCEEGLKNINDVNIKLIDCYIYKNKNQKAPPQMYSFFFKVNY